MALFKTFMIAQTTMGRHRRQVKKTRVLAALLGAFVITACGAGSGGSQTSTEAVNVPREETYEEIVANASETIDAKTDDGAAEETPQLLPGLEAADMSGYAALAGYEKPLVFVDMTVADILERMDRGETFAVVASFADCPWCNAVITYVNDAALEVSVPVGLLDTRKDPSWVSNLQITDYDLFVERFGEYLSYDSDERLHLYTPHIFFIRDGEVVAEHQGAIPEMGSDPATPLDDRMKEKLIDIYRDGFRRMLGL